LGQLYFTVSIIRVTSSHLEAQRAQSQQKAMHRAALEMMAEEWGGGEISLIKTMMGILSAEVLRGE